MNSLQNVLENKFDDKLSSEGCNFIASRKVNFSRNIFCNYAGYCWLCWNMESYVSCSVIYKSYKLKKRRTL